MDLQRASDLRASIRDGEPVVGGWVSIGHPAVAEITADAGPDFVVVDGEHGELDLGDVPDAIRAIETGGDAAPFVRVPAVDAAAIKRALDAGAAGIMVPRVDDAADAERVVAATTYPPAGVRGTAGTRASRYGEDLPEHVTDADDAVTRLVQVETERAVEHAAEIAAVDGIDALFVGPADLSTALDVPLDYDAEPFRAAVREVVDAAEREGVRKGIFVTDPDRIDDWLDLGFDFAVVGYDAAFLRSGTERLVGAFRSAADE